MVASFATKWFVLYYSILGCIFLMAGIGMLLKTDTIVTYLLAQAKSDQPPAVPRTILKYFFLFTLTCLALSFFPFSWPELLFSIWSLIIVYVAGIQLVRWPQRRQIINSNPEKIYRLITMTAAMMVAVSPVIFLLGYLILRKII